MRKLCYHSIKGGVGKTTLTILTTLYLSKILGKKVIVIDSDFQNSTSHYFVTNEDKRNVSDAMYDNDIESNIIPINDNLHILQSSLKLLKMQTIPHKTLQPLLDSISNQYDWCIIDAPPTYNAIVINVLLSADIIITPVIHECFFDIKTSLALKDLMQKDYDYLLDRWKLLFTRVRKARSETGITTRYDQQFRNYFSNILQTTIPDTRQFGQIIDSKSPLDPSWDKVYPAIESLFNEINLIGVNNEKTIGI